MSRYFGHVSKTPNLAQDNYALQAASGESGMVRGWPFLVCSMWRVRLSMSTHPRPILRSSPLRIAVSMANLMIG